MNGLRLEILNNFGYLNLLPDAEINKGLRAKEAIITKPESSVIAMVVPTNEELVIARDAYQIVTNL